MRWPRLRPPLALPRGSGSAARVPRGSGSAARVHDDFAWLGEPSSPEVASQLRAEAAYAAAHLDPLTGAQMELYRQLASSIALEDESTREPWGDYDYYTRTPVKRDLPRFCRQRRDGGDEELLLDLGALADRHGFASLGAFAVSPSHELLAYTLDTTGAEQWSLHVTEIASGAVHACIPGALAVEWADEEGLVYTRANRRGRPSTALLHALGGGLRQDATLYEEEDEAFALDLAATKGRRRG